MNLISNNRKITKIITDIIETIINNGLLCPPNHSLVEKMVLLAETPNTTPDIMIKIS